VDEKDLCGACGLCCDGPLFSHVELTREEEPVMRRHGVPLFQQGRRLAFAQPCAAHRGDHCGVYAERPRSCAEYRCALLRRVDAGEVGHAEALERVAEARALVAGLRVLAGPASDESAAPRNLWDALAARIAAEGERAETLEWRRAHQTLLLEVAAVTTFLRRHFQPSLRRSLPPHSAPPRPVTDVV